MTFDSWTVGVILGILLAIAISQWFYWRIQARRWEEKYWHMCGRAMVERQAAKEARR